MPYPKREVTREVLLEMIKPGQIYAPYNLGRKLRAQSVDVKRVLFALVDEGKLATIRPHKTLCFILKGSVHMRKRPAPKQVIDPATIAQPRTYAVLTGEMTGYFAEINRRAELAMMARPR
ncbi:hypothetical protein [Paraburkholderia sp. BL9I2N2]|uniref:hypothetical protein n=1 Tax=Paraburkholderia sp. BL9I2N2 TaxID=1938809 RepID=UPI00104FEBD0|nr:hypothetical protein [Paraburkholderia sp. BL9I2N2]TCK87313.1 hypothetical protein B0G74_7851 [Paraburkholderia sp. BL9I2N2]